MSSGGSAACNTTPASLSTCSQCASFAEILVNNYSISTKLWFSNRSPTSFFSAMAMCVTIFTTMLRSGTSVNLLRVILRPVCRDKKWYVPCRFPVGLRQMAPCVPSSIFLWCFCCRALVRMNWRGSCSSSCGILPCHDGAWAVSLWKFDLWRKRIE